MPKRSDPQIAAAHLSALQVFLQNFDAELNAQDLRAQVCALIPVYRELRNLGASLISPELAQSGRERILYYFQKYPFQLIQTEEVMVVAGILDYPRRIRELRVQFGWYIVGGKTAKELFIAGDWNTTALGWLPEAMNPEDYVLLSVTQDVNAAYRWNMANAIRKEKSGARSKILKFLRANVGVGVTSEEIRYVANDTTEWARRVRELRTEEGWPIVTRQTGDPQLPVGVYLLEADHALSPHDRKIPDSVRIEVLERDHFKCTNPNCLWSRDQRTREDPRQFLELHHVQFHGAGGANTADNLLTLCNVCHDRIHAGALIIDWS